MSAGPDYEKPEVRSPDAWDAAVRNEFAAGEPDFKAWWKIFDDETLNGLIERASTNNLDLKAAAARIEQAAALRGVAASEFFPDVFGGGDAQRVHLRQDQTPPGAKRRGTMYRAGLTMAWELDLWGRIRRSVESADASLQATVEDYRDVMVLLYAQVAAGYVEVRTLQERISFAENNLKTQTATLKLTRNRFDAGLVPALDVSQAELNRSRTASLIPPLEQKLTVALNRLSVLIGEMPYALRRELERPAPIPLVPGKVVVGLPAELLRQRPDVRRAERELAAQNALIGAKKAEYYPSLSLPGSLSYGVMSHGSDLFESANAGLAIGPQVNWNLFAGGRIRSEVKAEKAATKAALHAYRQTVLRAYEEAENGMAAYANERTRIAELETAAQSAKKSVELVTELYKQGLTDFQNVLVMERDLLTQQDELASSRGKIDADLVAIYKALGGGWNPDLYAER